MKPVDKPENPNFSSGPCSKRPGYELNNLAIDTLGRSHRSALGKQVLARVCDETAELLGLPEGYRVALRRSERLSLLPAWKETARFLNRAALSADRAW